MSAHPMTIRLVDLDDNLRIRDLTDPASGPHAIQLIVADVIDALAADWACEVRRLTGRRVVSIEDNYDHLGYERDAVTLDARYTRYVEPHRVLRSHSSAMIPPALRELAAEGRAGEAPPDVLLAAPGICYRRDSVDWQHTGTPHQMDLWRISRHDAGAAPAAGGCTVTDLRRMVATVVAAALPGRAWRLVETRHPYTTEGRQIDVLVDGSWIEVGECGLASAKVLAAAGLDPAHWSGLAMGLGLDRLLMLRKGIPDIRLLRSGDLRVADQMHDLAPYRVVSHLPPIRRDLSLVVGHDVDTSAEALGDRVRAALGTDADSAETVEPLSITGYDELAPRVRDRLGMRVGQRNLLLRVVLRSLERSLTDREANEMRDRIYAALHEGSHHEWATSRRLSST
jgi:phenylalanyl-tRNA synthetase alpha chain